MLDKTLRGATEKLQAMLPASMNYGTRSDGTTKGPGFFGQVFTDDPELFSTELAGSCTTDGKKELYPLIVPTLTAEELAHLVDGGQPTVDIMKKARDHAWKRLDEGKSPFAALGEQLPLPRSALSEFTSGYEEAP